jgi:peptide/nickel transport system permease protein
MAIYILRRVIAMVPTFILITIFVFAVIRFIPGDIADIMVENFQYADDREELRRRLGLDQPVYIQYVEWVGGMLQGDFGTSLWTQQTITEELRRRLPVTIQLGLMSIGLTVIVAIPIGVLSAMRQDTGIDYGARSVSILNLSMPDFWVATLVIVFPSIWWGVNMAPRYVPIWVDPIASILALVTPAIILGLSRSASVMRMTRAMMLEVMRQDYIRTAQAKGLHSARIIQRHAIKNALIPVITVIGLQIPLILGGTVIIETIFNLPGTGRFMLDSIRQRDYPLLQATVVVFALFVMFTNLVVDLFYGYLDPRIRYS